MCPSPSERYPEVLSDTGAQLLDLDESAAFPVGIGFDHRIQEARNDMLCGVFADMLSMDEGTYNGSDSEAVGVIHSAMLP